MALNLEDSLNAQISEAERIKEFHRLTAIREISQSESLRFFFRELIAECGVASSPFDEDPNKTYVLIGRQQVGQMIIAKIVAADTKLWPVMLMEELNAQV